MSQASKRLAQSASSVTTALLGCVTPLPNNPTACKIAVNLRPNAASNQVVAVDLTLDLKINAPPREGAANEETTDFIAEILQIKKRQVQLIAGAKSRDKVFQISELTPSLASSRLNEIKQKLLEE